MSHAEFSTTGLPESDARSLAEATIDAGGAMQQIRTSYATAIAVQRPREIEEVRKRLLREAQHGGETFYYGWATKGKKKGRIEGPSVNLAIAAARCWGNCAVEPQALQDTPDAWICTAAFIDLETGFTIGRQFRQSKASMVYGDMDSERKDDIRFQIGQSKAVRNVICKALPKWLIDQAIETAKQGVRQKIEQYIEKKGVQKAVDFIVSELGKQGVSEGQILAKCEIVELRAMTVDHIVVLKGDLVALQQGEERVEALFADTEAADMAAKLAAKTTPTPAEPAADASPKTATQSPVDGRPNEYLQRISIARTIDALNEVINDLDADPDATDPMREHVQSAVDERKAVLRKVYA